MNLSQLQDPSTNVALLAQKHSGHEYADDEDDYWDQDNFDSNNQGRSRRSSIDSVGSGGYLGNDDGGDYQHGGGGGGASSFVGGGGGGGTNQNTAAPVVKDVLDYNKADINAVDRQGNTALHWACWYRDHKLFDLLVEREGLDILRRNSTGETAVHWAAKSGRRILGG